MTQPNMLHAYLMEANVADWHRNPIPMGRRRARRRRLLLLALLLGGLL